MKLFKRTLTTAVAVCLALQSAVVCFGAEAEEQIPAGGEEVGLYTSENDEAIQLTEDMYSSWYEGDQTYDGTEKTLYGYSLKDSNNYYQLTEDEDYVVTYENNINVGTATATFTGIGNYTGSFTKNFNIVPTDIYRANITTSMSRAIVPVNLFSQNLLLHTMILCLLRALTMRLNMRTTVASLAGIMLILKVSATLMEPIPLSIAL